MLKDVLLRDTLFADEFHGVQFSKVPGLPCSKQILPTEEFYATLYRIIKPGEIRDKEKFIQSKTDWADVISNYVPEKGSVLSWGAGLGIVESVLHEKYDLNVDGVEFEKNDKFWSPSVNYFSHIDEVPASKQYDLVVESSCFYALTDQQLHSIVVRLKGFVKPGGRLLLIEQETLSWLEYVRSILVRIKNSRNRYVTLWGYLRSPSFYQELDDHEDTKYFDFNDKDWSFKEIPSVSRFLGRQLLRRNSRSQLHSYRML